MTGGLFDLLLAATLVALAWRVLHTADAFESVAVFIVFGLLMAIAWARLSAPDISLAEAAIGAGLTGVLFLDTLRALRSGKAEGAGASRRASRTSWSALGTTALLALLLIAAVLSLPQEAPSLVGHVTAALPESGVSHPVTAVLLNFRGYDTWLELGVLLIAVIAVLSLRGWGSGLAERPPGGAEAPLLWLARLLVPVAVLVAGYLLWLGKSAAGGAFQAGVVLGAAGVLLWLAGWRPLKHDWQWRLLLGAGFGLFLAIGVGLLARGGLLFEFPPEWAGTLILVIEAGAALSIGATMAALFAGLHSLGANPTGGAEAPPRL